MYEVEPRNSLTRTKYKTVTKLMKSFTISDPKTKLQKKRHPSHSFHQNRLKDTRVVKAVAFLGSKEHFRGILHSYSFRNVKWWSVRPLGIKIRGVVKVSVYGSMGKI